MGKQIRNITIVGGGTAGWMTALLLQRRLAVKSSGKNKITVTLVESPNIATVGVGEATVPGMPATLREAGIQESEFFRTCNASFKLGVLFDNWNVNKNGEKIAYINPFNRASPIDGIDVAEYYFRYGVRGAKFSEIMSPATYCMRRLKGPRPLGAPAYDTKQGFAYHLDAGKFAAMLTAFCKRKGVVHLRDDMVGVTKNDRGLIESIQLKETGEHKTDFVIDCTGFRGLLINKEMGEPFLDYSRYLANDRALAVQIPHADPGKIEPVTRSSALGAGWSWRVPLYNRIGTGYVFSSAHRTDDEARDEFMGFLGDQAKGLEPRVIPMRIGRTRKTWVGNCLAIGLSGGFIEPLESTAIYMIEMAVRWLITYFPDTDFEPSLQNAYNQRVNYLYDEVLDFICMHYRLGNRTDSQYWIDARTELQIPDRLKERLDLWRHKLPGRDDIGEHYLFDHWTYQVVLLGKEVYDNGFGPGPVNSPLDLDRKKWVAFLKTYEMGVKDRLSRIADHKALLDDIRGPETEVVEERTPESAIL